MVTVHWYLQEREKVIENIVIVSNSGSIGGGASKIAIETALILSKTNRNVYFFCGSGPVCKDIEKSSIKVKCLDCSSYFERSNPIISAIDGLYDRKAEAAFFAFIKDLPTEKTVVHFHSWLHTLSPALFKTTKKLGFNIFITIHDYSLVCPNAALFDFRSNQICGIQPMSIKCLMRNCDKRSWMQKLFRFMRTKIMLRLIDKNETTKIFISNYSATVFKSAQLPDAKTGNLEYLPNPIPIKKKEKYANLDKTDSYLYVGRLSPEKGVSLFCRAVTDLGKSAEIIGDGELAVSLMNDYPNICFSGWQPEDYVYKKMLSAKVLVFPSVWHETMGLTVLEAQSQAALPCIVPDQCSASEYVENEITGLVFNSGSVESLKSCMERMDSVEVREEMITNIERKDFEEYDEKKYEVKLIDIYERNSITNNGKR